MPNLRIIFVRLFPKALGSTQHTDAKHYIGNDHSQIEGNISVHSPWKSSKGEQTSMNGITTSHTYTVQYANHPRETDEVELMEVGGRTKEGKSNLNSSQISQVSDGSF